jgi:hypothetical protein
MKNRVFKENRRIDNPSSRKKVSIAPGLLEFVCQEFNNRRKADARNAHKDTTKQLLSDQGFCLRRSVPPGGRKTPHRSQKPAGFQRQVLQMPEGIPWVRHPRRTAVPVHSYVGLSSRSCVSSKEGQVSRAWCDRGASVLGDRQEFNHHTVSALSFPLGEIPFLEGGSPTVQRQLAAGLRIHRACGHLRPQTSRYGQHPRRWRRRDPISEGTSLPDPGLSNRPRMPEASVYRRAANRQDTSQILQTTGQIQMHPDSSGLLGSMEAVSEGHQKKTDSCGPYPGQVPYHAVL